MSNLRPTENIEDLGQIVHGGITLDQGSDRLISGFNGLWDAIYILRLDNSFQVVFENFGEVVCLVLVSETAARIEDSIL